MYVQGVSTRKVFPPSSKNSAAIPSSLHPGQPVRRPAGHPVAGLAGAAPGRVSLPAPGCPLRKSPPRRQPTPGLRDPHCPGRQHRGQTHHSGRQRRPERSRPPIGGNFSTASKAVDSTACNSSSATTTPTLRAARRAVFPAVPWQRRQFHLQKNAQAFVPRKRWTSAPPSRTPSAACSTAPTAPPPNASACRKSSRPMPCPPRSCPPGSKNNLPQGFTVFALPPAHQRRLRCTSNPLERVNQELKRRNAQAWPGFFPNEASLLRLVTALLNEISDEIGKPEKSTSTWKTQPSPQFKC